MSIPKKVFFDIKATNIGNQKMVVVSSHLKKWEKKKWKIQRGEEKSADQGSRESN